ncbi:NUDIX hydrolase [Alteribacter natronophilus]|uniref:NUDIX hydrolase n=1 Tax=Alteribacter natronophilus TaxID=2583810 RepID=UPI001FE7C26E|nr:NUDIX domain-containing protein [Alteribacter natronophilus]
MEILKTFNEKHEQTGTAPREEVHRKGFWHETFHCWFVAKEKEDIGLYFQMRSSEKKDYPSLLDITAAGHLLADESVRDGVREVKEETGVSVSMDDLISLGVIRLTDPGIRRGFSDNEFAHTFLYKYTGGTDRLVPQQGEVDGFYRVSLDEVEALFEGKQETALLQCCSVPAGPDKEASADDFLPHGHQYYLNLVKKIRGVFD